MSDENLESTPDAFEAALASSAESTETISETAVAVAESVEVTEEDPNAEFRRALENAPGEWFVVHSYAGYEKKVKANLQNRINTLHMEDYIYQIEVPEEEFTEIKNGQRKTVKRNVYPGYVLVRMDFSDESWSCSS